MVLRTISVKNNTFLLKQMAKLPIVCRRLQYSQFINSWKILRELIFANHILWQNSRKLIFANRNFRGSKKEFMFANLAKISEIFFLRKFLPLRYIGARKGFKAIGRPGSKNICYNLFERFPWGEIMAFYKCKKKFLSKVM